MTSNFSGVALIQDPTPSYLYVVLLSTKWSRLVRLGFRYLVVSGVYSSENADNMKMGAGILKVDSYINSTFNISGYISLNTPLNTTGKVIKTAEYWTGW